VNLTKKEVQNFQAKILKHFQAHGRPYPWRDAPSPYNVLVSELMLQQTQTDRVVPKFTAFISAYPDFNSLSKASQADVLTLWQGLGYNRRALFLLKCAIEVVENRKGALPKTIEGLQTLPGIGPYTASAIMCFAYNKPCIVIETNVRTVFIHEFFKDRVDDVHDSELIPLIDQTCPINARVWYNAVFDYGAYLKKTVGNVTRKSKSYQKQSAFEGSKRQIRGAVIRMLTDGSATASKLSKVVVDERLPLVLLDLETEGFIEKIGRCYVLKK
jgi:A/G-specific adenine glycosylase